MMTTPDPHARLTTAEVHAQAGPGFAQIRNRLKARYRTGNFATGLELANRIGALAETWDHHPDLDLTYTDLVVTLVSHDDGAITPRDIRMSRLIAREAAEMGLSATVTGLTQVELGLDCAEAGPLRPFYAALLGVEDGDGDEDIVDPTGQVPTVWGQDASPSEEPVEQRWHLDVWVAQDAAPERLAAVIAADGHLVDDSSAPRFWVVADADGNRHCLCTPEGR